MWLNLNPTLSVPVSVIENTPHCQHTNKNFRYRSFQNVFWKILSFILYFDVYELTSQEVLFFDVDGANWRRSLWRQFGFQGILLFFLTHLGIWKLGFLDAHPSLFPGVSWNCRIGFQEARKIWSFKPNHVRIKFQAFNVTIPITMSPKLMAFVGFGINPKPRNPLDIMIW